MNPMSRFASLTVTLIAIVAVGSQSGHGAGVNKKSLKSMCVCVPHSGGTAREGGDCQDSGVRSVCGVFWGELYCSPVTNWCYCWR